MPAQATPELLSPPLATGWLGRQYTYAAVAGSTNTLAHQLAADGGAHGAVVVADAQTRGRGRLHRNWHSPPGVNLYLSVLLRPDWDAHRGPPISLAAGVALAEAVEEILGRPPQLKWPNDLLHGERKLAGILVEAAAQQQMRYVVIGLGLNVNQTQFPSELEDTATSLCLAAGRTFDRAEVLSVVLARWEIWIDKLSRQPDAVVPRWLDFAPWLGRRIRVRQSRSEIAGTAISLTSGGALRLRDDAGVEHQILAGDATCADEDQLAS